MSRTTWFTWAAGLLAPALVGVTVILATHEVSPLVTGKPDAPVVVRVSEGTAADSTVTPVKVVHGAVFEALSPLGGVVTSIAVSAGDEVRTGDLVATVNDAPVVAMQLEGPLWRDVGPGVRGSDVARLQRALAAEGLLDGQADGVAGPATAAALRSFNRSHGLGDTPVLRVDTILWIGPDPLLIGAVPVGLGQSVSPGDVLIAGPEVATGLELLQPVSADNRAGDYVLEIAGVIVPYVLGATEISDREAATAVAEAISPAPDGTATVRLATPVPVKIIPASAIITAGDGTMCVFPDVDSPPVVVTPVGGGFSDVHLPVSFAPTTVVVNPRVLDRELTCS